MKKIFSTAAVAALVVAGLTVSHESASAAPAAPATFSVDCTSTDTLNDETLVSGKIERIFTGAVNDTFTITNIGSAACEVPAATSVVTTAGSATTIAASGNAGDSLVFTIVASGAFQIEPNAGVGDNEVVFAVDADDCSLAGAGIETAPFLVGADDLPQVGASSACGLDKHYLQTAPIVADALEDRITGNFSGVYDGDHYQISLSTYWRTGTNEGGDYLARGGLFQAVVGGQIKKVNLTGEIRSSSALVGALVDTFSSGVISEVESRVNIEVSADTVIAGGIVGQLGDGSTARIQYSKYASSSGLQHFTANPSGTDVALVTLGGLVGSAVGSTSLLEIRDSYSQAAFSFNTDNNDDTANSGAGAEIRVGGLLGEEGPGAETRLVRNYSVSSVADNCSPTGCESLSRKIGGLVGIADDDTYLSFSQQALVANFFTTGSLVSRAVGGFTSGSTQPVDYVESGDLILAPVAVPVSTTEMRLLGTFTTKEAPASPGNPGGDEITAAASNGTSATIADYRWAITGSRSTFVPSTYTMTAEDDPGSLGQQLNYYNRNLYDPSVDGAKEYLRERLGDLTAYGGDDPRSTTTYTTLGHVWEICAGEDYPTLVWEEVNNCGTGGSSSRGDDDSSTSAAALGLTDAEYAEFLASGLTLEQFLAARLAATGPASSAMTLGVGAVMLLLVMGLAMVSTARRWTGPGSSPTP